MYFQPATGIKAPKKRANQIAVDGNRRAMFNAASNEGKNPVGYRLLCFAWEKHEP